MSAKQDRPTATVSARSTASSTTLPYASAPRRTRGDIFASWYGTFAAIGIAVGGLFALLDGAVATVLVLGASSIDWVNLISAFIQIAFSLFLDALLVVGSAKTLWRSPSARKLLVSFATGQFVAALIFLAIFVFLPWQAIEPRERTRLKIGMSVIVARCLCALLCWAAYKNVRADFYFDDHHPPPEPRRLVDEELNDRTQVVAAQAQKARAFRFRVRGVDSSNGESVEFFSKAATEELALKSALAMGLQQTSINIEPVTNA